MKPGMRLVEYGLAVLMGSVALLAQGPAPGRSGPPPTPKASAAEDVTGYWVALVTEDWRWRMVTPAKGDYDGVPINAAARKVADAWNPAKDQATGNQCKAYGAAAISRVPGRLHITWQDDTTLKVETDAGTQTRLFHFAGKAPGREAGWQGFSLATWEHQAGGGFGGPPSGPGGSLKIVTTHMRPGYLRKNGIPYSGNAAVTEYFDAVKEPDGEQYLIIKTLVDDPQYLTGTFITSTHFKKEADGSKWHPTACSAK